MLPHKYRLTRSEDFRRVHAEGRSWSSRMLVLRTSTNGLGHSRFGFSVSRRIGNAVVRNRVKRLLREAVRARLDSLPSGWDVVLVARQRIRGASYQDIDRSLGDLLEWAGLSHPPEALAGGVDGDG